MAEIKITIPDEKKQRVITAFKNIYPIPEISKLEFTEEQWVRERTRRFIVETVKGYEYDIFIKDAAESFEGDDNIVQ